MATPIVWSAGVPKAELHTIFEVIRRGSKRSSTSMTSEQEAASREATVESATPGFDSQKPVSIKDFAPCCQRFVFDSIDGAAKHSVGGLDDKQDIGFGSPPFLTHLWRNL